MRCSINKWKKKSWEVSNMINICSFILHAILNLQTCFWKNPGIPNKATLVFLLAFDWNCFNYRSFIFIYIIFNSAPCPHSAARRRLETTGLDPHLHPASRTIYHRVNMYSLNKDKIPNFNISRKSFLAAAVTEEYNYLSGKQQNFILF